MPSCVQAFKIPNPHFEMKKNKVWMQQRLFQHSCFKPGTKKSKRGWATRIQRFRRPLCCLLHQQHVLGHWEGVISCLVACRVWHCLSNRWWATLTPLFRFKDYLGSNFIYLSIKWTATLTAVIFSTQVAPAISRCAVDWWMCFVLIPCYPNLQVMTIRGRNTLKHTQQPTCNPPGLKG